MKGKHFLLVAGALVTLVVGGAAISHYQATQLVASPSNKTQGEPTSMVAKPAPRAHNYYVKDGMDYGYPRALSSVEKQAGQAAEAVVMFRYAGVRDGKHQVHSHDGQLFIAFECENPCGVIKAMSFIDADMLRDTVKIERFVNAKGTVAAGVFEDVFAGELRQYGMERGNKRYQVWVDDRGRREYALN